MKTKSIGFIGGGRITQILLNALFGKENFKTKVVVSDLDLKCLAKIEKKFPKVKITNDNSDAAILISLAPMLKMRFLSESLNSHKNIVRCIPNSPSMINKGYNPISFYEFFDPDYKDQVFEIFNDFGTCFETKEGKLETYAIITAMGPTYFQFQVKKLLELAEEFGLDQQESALALKNMLGGMNSLLFDSELDYEQIIDLIPVRPIHKSEDNILAIYDNSLRSLYEKLTSS